jgi:hypothetical protein
MHMRNEYKEITLDELYVNWIDAGCTCEFGRWYDLCRTFGFTIL